MRNVTTAELDQHANFLNTNYRKIVYTGGNKVGMLIGFGLSPALNVNWIIEIIDLKAFPPNVASAAYTASQAAAFFVGGHCPTLDLTKHYFIVHNHAIIKVDDGVAKAQNWIQTKTLQSQEGSVAAVAQKYAGYRVRYVDPRSGTAVVGRLVGYNGAEYLREDDHATLRSLLSTNVYTIDKDTIVHRVHTCDEYEIDLNSAPLFTVKLSAALPGTPGKPKRVIPEFPHECRFCHGPAYVGMHKTDCKKKCPGSIA